MLCYPMLWYGMESMVWYEISMLCYEISMPCYAMVYVVKDKHSATVICQEIYKFDNQLNDNLWLRYWIKLWKTYLYLLVEENNH